MNTSVSPLPIPLWPMLVLSLTLFIVTSLAATVSARQASYSDTMQQQNSLETAAPVVTRHLTASSRVTPADMRAQN